MRSPFRYHILKGLLTKQNYMNYYFLLTFQMAPVPGS